MSTSRQLSNRSQFFRIFHFDLLFCHHLIRILRFGESLIYFLIPLHQPAQHPKNLHTSQKSTNMAEDNGIYLYAPSKIACIIAIGLFGISAAYHLFQLIRSKAWFYTSFVVGSLS
jgi:hypothetical protein